MRFDGNRVDVYDRASLPFLSSDSFYKVYEDKDTVLWFASQGSRIVSLRNGIFKPFHPDDLPKSPCSCLPLAVISTGLSFSTVNHFTICLRISAVKEKHLGFILCRSSVFCCALPGLYNFAPLPRFGVFRFNSR